MRSLCRFIKKRQIWENVDEMNQYKQGEHIAGEYTVLKVFGGENKSGMGVVYLVQNREIPRPIILKTFQHSISEDTKRLFLSEARAWINAGAHTNIVQAYWVREITGQVFVAAEYLKPDEEGRNTLTHFISEGQLTPEIILLWSTQFCHAMNYAKSKGILVHRDIKPDNLMIDSNACLKVTDFGLAKSIELDDQSKFGWYFLGRKQTPKTISKTMTGSVMGSLPYMAPEQFINAKWADHRADIYSFGIILYQMVSGNRYPYSINTDSADILTEFYRAHTEQTLAVIDSPLMPIITRCMEKDPNRRYPSYDDFLNDIFAISKKLRIKLPKAIHIAKEDEELYAKAQSYVALGDKDRALKAIDEYILKYPENECGWTEKGRIHFERGEYEKGVTATRKSLEVNPYNTHAWNNLGILLNSAKAPIYEIKEALANALHFDPYNTAAMMNLVGPLVSHKEYAEAAMFTARALKLRPDKPLVLQKAEALLKEILNDQNFSVAETLLTGWVKARPSDAKAWHNLGLMSINNENLDQAIICFNQVRELSPQDNFSIAQLAKLYFQKKKPRECLEACNKLLQIGYESLLAVSLKARVLNFIGGYEQALKFIQPYIDNSPENDALWVIIAEIHEYRENYDSATQALNKAKLILKYNGKQNNDESIKLIDLKLKELAVTQRV